MEGAEWWIWIQAGGKKTEKMVQVYQSQHFMKGRNSLPPLHIEEQLKRCSVLIILLNIPLRTWSGTTTFSLWLKRCTGKLYFLRKWRNTGLGNSVLKLFYRCVVESSLCCCITVWHGICSMAKKMTLPAVVKTTQRIVSSSLHTTKLIYTNICQKCSQFNTETQKDIGQGLYCIFIISRGRATEIS